MPSLRARLKRAISRRRRHKAAAQAQRRPPAAAPEPAHRDALLRSLERGKGLEHALVGQVRALAAAGDHDSALALAESLRRRERWSKLHVVRA